MMRQSLPLTPSPPNAKRFSAALLRWFSQHRRNLPWRSEPRDPYRVWLSEVMLQQTQVNTVIPYYERWLRRFPTLSSLASAPASAVLKKWEGLGYYARARNLHRAARVVMREYGGHIPTNVELLRNLPGIGRYTAGAIASLAFNQDEPAVDGNVARVLARFFTIHGDVRKRTTVELLWFLSKSLIPQGQAGAFNEALMDLGALICIPLEPKCHICPLSRHCSAYANGNPQAWPVTSPSAVIPVKNIVSIVLFDQHDRLLLAQRPPRGLLGGLWEFPACSIKPSAASLSNLAQSITQRARQIIYQRTRLRVQVRQDNVLDTVTHRFSHFQMVSHVVVVHLRRSAPAIQSDSTYVKMLWVTMTRIRTLALARHTRHIAGLVAALYSERAVPQ